MSRRPTSKLASVIAALRRAYGPPLAHLPTTIFGFVAWENLGYLATDAERARAWTTLEKDVGVTPAAVGTAPLETLERICAIGGPFAAKRAENLKAAAAIATDISIRKLDAVAAGPLPAALKALQRFPMIGRPGAERILAELGYHAVLGLDSNALRCLLRMGYGRERKSYAASYVSVQEAAAPELPLPAAGLTEASRLLRHHGLQTCRRIIPRCDGCAVRHLCVHGKGIVPR